MQQTARNQAEIEVLKESAGRLITVADRMLAIQTQQGNLVDRLAEAQLKTEERLNRIATESNERQDRTDHALNALMDMVDRILPRLPKQ